MEITDIQQNIKETIECYVNAFNPCEMCENEDRDNSNKLQECKKCCFYYPSRFEPKEKK